jgi:hypothetical protein
LLLTLTFDFLEPRAGLEIRLKIETAGCRAHQAACGRAASKKPIAIWLGWANAWKILALNERRAFCTDIRIFDLSNIRKHRRGSRRSIQNFPIEISRLAGNCSGLHVLAA